MIDFLVSASTTLSKRAMEKGGDGQIPEMPWYGQLIFMLNLLLFVPGILFTCYTLGSVVPTLAMVEDPNPSPPYEPLSLGDRDEEAQQEQQQQQQPGGVRKPTDHPSQARVVGGGLEVLAVGPVTASVRKTARLLRLSGGWKSYFRGFVCAFCIAVSTGLATALFRSLPFVPAILGRLLATLALVQMHTAWVHIVISSHPVSLAFWRRLPPFRRTLEATLMPILAVFAATLAQSVPVLVATLWGGLQTWDPLEPGKVPKYDGSAAWKSALVAVASVAISVFLVIPASVALVRVQASLLPEDQDTIVAFDRSFGGAVEPAIVGGRGYATVKDALRTFSRASWVRLYTVYFKTFAIIVVFFMFMASCLIAEVVLFGSKK